MNPETRVAVVTDSGCSIRPDYPEAKNLGVMVVPLELKLWENGNYVPYPDTAITPEELYQRMREQPKNLPQTSGSIQGPLIETFKRLSDEKKPIVSIHVTSKHSGAYNSAITAKDIVYENAKNEGKEPVPIEVIDSKLVTLAMWFPVQLAGELAKKGATVEQIKNEVLDVIPKTHLYFILQTFENLKHGGRAKQIVQAYAASLLRIVPVMGLKDGELTDFARVRTDKKAKDRMIEMVGDAGKLLNVAVVHTNALDIAQTMRNDLRKIYKGDISIYEAQAVLGVHAAEGGVGIAFQTA
jgi:DegV family protein with EDD domain